MYAASKRPLQGPAYSTHSALTLTPASSAWCHPAQRARVLLAAAHCLQCALDDTAPLAREWALWAVRNLCVGSERARATASALQPVRGRARPHQAAADPWTLIRSQPQSLDACLTPSRHVPARALAPAQRGSTGPRPQAHAQPLSCCLARLWCVRCEGLGALAPLVGRYRRLLNRHVCTHLARGGGAGRLGACAPPQVGSVETPELSKLGLKLELDAVSGKMNVVKTAKSGE
jgi:hypothetical protein